MKKIRISLLLFSAILLASMSHAQQPDTLGLRLQQMMEDQLERITESAEENYDFTDLLEDYQFLAENPVNINSDDIMLLEQLNLLSSLQVENLRQYIKKYGMLYTLFELSAVEGFDDQTIELISPLVYAGEVTKTEKIKVANVARWGKHQLISRVERTLEQQKGYSSIDEAAWNASPNARYLGDPYKIYARYTFNYRNKIRAGITMDKDAGEVFLKNSLPDSLAATAENKVRNGFDFYSIHLFASGIGPLKAIALGDYHIAFGQGLTLWSGLSFGKSTDPNGVMKYGQGIRPNTSVNEVFFMRGAAATYGWKNIELTAFYSNKDIDASISLPDTLDDEVIFASSLQETGLHRTISELSKKGTVGQEVYGGRLSLTSNRFEAGVTLHETRLDAALTPTTYPYNQFRFSGKNLSNQGIDFRWVMPQLILFGEVSRSSNSSLAGIAGMVVQPASFAHLTLAWRHYDKSYHNLFTNGFGESTGTNNESGIYAGLRTGLSARWSLTAYADLFRFQWLRYQTDAPSFGQDYFVQFDHRLSRKADFYFRYRYKNKMTNDNSSWQRIDPVTIYNKQSVRFHISYVISPVFIFKNRAEWIIYKQTNQPESNGFLIYHDVLYRPGNKPYDFTLRYAMFDSESYDSRLYAYENDVLNAFSIPAFSGRGTRIYLLMKLSLHHSLDLWFRVAQTWYADRKTVGTGLDLIEGNRKTDAKIQLRWKF
jgi:hypothetical protein